MRTFTCPECRHLVPFESEVCVRCGISLAFDWERRTFTALDDTLACANRGVIGCNGAAPAPAELCAACAVTRGRPAADDPAGMQQWSTAEQAKRRLVFSLLEVGLPVRGYREREDGLAFDLHSSTHAQVTTGYAAGTITLNLSEADSAYREQTRVALREPYRTVVGHLRHEVGHYYQPLLAPEGTRARERCRQLMGDETTDYAAAMDRHYAEGPPQDWPDRFVSAYGSMHPTEDWAETFAHYLHIRDVLQTAVAYGITVAGPALPSADARPLYAYPAAAPGDFGAMLDTWVPLSYALNAMNRSLGADDLYPFVIAPAVAEKLALVDSLVRERTP